MKFFSLCEDCDYLWNTYVYVGKDAANEDSDLVKRLGKKFMLPLFSKGYHLYVDNWYAGENLAHYFLENETWMCGTAMPWRLTHSWRRPLSYRNQSTDLLWFALLWGVENLHFGEMEMFWWFIYKTKFFFLCFRNTFSQNFQCWRRKRK